MDNQTTDFFEHLSSILSLAEIENINLSDLNVFGSQMNEITNNEKIVGEMLLHERKLFYLMIIKERELVEFLENHTKKTQGHEHSRCNKDCIKLKKLEIQYYALYLLFWSWVRQRLPNFYSLGSAKDFKIVTPVHVSHAGFPPLEDKDKPQLSWSSIHEIMIGPCERAWNRVDSD